MKEGFFNSPYNVLRYTFDVLRRTPLVFIGLLLFLPAIAEASSEVTWDFRGKNVSGSWQVSSALTAEPTDAGLRIRASEDSNMFRPYDVPFTAGEIVLTTDATVEHQALLLWHNAGAPGDQAVQLPILIEPGNAKSRSFDMTLFRQWRHPDGIGFSFPKGTDVTIVSIAFRSSSSAEKIGNAWSSFWLFDRFGQTSINFLWGPILRFTPVTQEELFGNPPPMGWSVNRIFYAVMAGVGLVGMALYLRNGRIEAARRKFLLLFLGVCAGLWLLYDIRMGAEFLSYVATDVRYLSLPPGERSFRQVQNLYDVVERSARILRTKRSFGLFYPQQTGVPSRVQYYAYPSLAVPNPASGSGLDAFLIFRRPDARVAENGALYVGDALLSPRGRILEEYDPASFLYERQP